MPLSLGEQTELLVNSGKPRFPLPSTLGESLPHVYEPSFPYLVLASSLHISIIPSNMDPTTQQLHLHTQSYLNHYINHIIQPDTYSVAECCRWELSCTCFCTSSDSFRGARKRFPDSMCGDPGDPGPPKASQGAAEANLPRSKTVPIWCAVLQAAMEEVRPWNGAWGLAH
jgi:hypothetical protein